jgi:putative ABC transport system permease protein
VNLAFKMLLRDWRSGELNLLFACLLVAVATVTGISGFAERLSESLYQQSKDFLAGSLVITSSKPISTDLLNIAQSQGLRSAVTTSMPSMAYANGKLQLTALKAVSPGYPLRGNLKISSAPFATSFQNVTTGPLQGEVWIASNMASLLDVSLGDRIEIGNIDLVITAFLIDEPDRGFEMFSMGPRVMMHLDDIAAAGLIMAGSRVSYSAQFDGDKETISKFKIFLESQIDEHQRIRTIDDAQPRLAESLERANNFLMLAGALAVMLAGLAIAMSTQRYCQRHYNHVAMLKTLGMTRPQIMKLYMTSLVLLAVVATILGGFIGLLVESLFVQAIRDFVELADMSFSWYAWGLGAATAFISMLTFAWPALYGLQKTSAMNVLRDLIPPNPIGFVWRIVLAATGTFILILMYTHSWLLALGLLFGVGIIVFVVNIFVGLLFKLPRKGISVASSFGLAWSNILRHRHPSSIQLVVYSCALMLVAILWAIRTDLLNDWRQQLPAGTPNHFLVNVAPEQVPLIQSFLTSNQIEVETIYPMVRGRLTHINDQLVRTLVSKENMRSIDRELNLTWNEQLPLKNEIVAGEWWQGNNDGVSIEQRLAERLDIKLNDSLRFQIGDLEVNTYVQSIRSLDWQQMRPNFYFMFAPGSLSDETSTYITSFFLDPSKKALLSELIQQFSTVTIIEMDSVIAQIEQTIERVSAAIEIVFILVLLATVLVIIASILASQHERQRDNALLRVLGAQSPFLWRSCGLEYVLMGCLASVLACLAAEASLALLQIKFMGMTANIHLSIWWGIPLFSLPLVIIIGLRASKASLYQSPGVLLRNS